MDKKKLLIFGATLLGLIILGLILMLVFKKEPQEEFKIDGIDLPENKEVLKDTQVEDLKITNVSIITRDGKSSFTASVENTSDTSTKINTLTIVFYEGDNKLEAIALYNTELYSNQKTNIKLTIEKDLTKTNKIEYILK